MTDVICNNEHCYFRRHRKCSLKEINITPQNLWDENHSYILRCGNFEEKDSEVYEYIFHWKNGEYHSRIEKEFASKVTLALCHKGYDSGSIPDLLYWISNSPKENEICTSDDILEKRRIL
jgi:hypothetical protein